MIWLEVYVVGLVFLLGILVGQHDKPDRLEVWGSILWPLWIPTAFVCNWWVRRQIRRWNALTMDQRRALNDAGKGGMAKRWPYRYTPWVPRGM